MAEESIGAALSRTLKNLLTQRAIPTFPDFRACKILKSPSGSACGVLATDLKTGAITRFKGKAVLVAAGGIGRLCSFSTYPRDVGGDGSALAYEAGAELIDMEFIQFEPTVILHPPSARGLLMPTVMLGDGAILTNARQARFMAERDPLRGEKNQKHVLAFAIEEEVARGSGSPHGGVYFDCRPIPPGVWPGYAEVVSSLKGLGIDITGTPVEVGPVAHSFMGGILIREDGSTRVPGLYAAGEAAGGIWGANRIAGTGGTAILVFGKAAGRAAASYAGSASAEEPVEKFIVADGKLDPLPVFQSVQAILADGSGLARDQGRLERGMEELQRIEKGPLKEIATRRPAHFLAYLDAAHGCATAQMVLAGALRRRETRGFHKRLDYPRKNDTDFLGNFVMQKDHLGPLAVSFRPQDR